MQMHTALPGGLPWGSLGTLCRRRWSGALKKTGHWSAKTNWSHLFLASPLPCTLGHWLQICLSILSHQDLQGEKQSKELGCSLRCRARPPGLQGLWEEAAVGTGI